MIKVAILFAVLISVSGCNGSAENNAANADSANAAGMTTSSTTDTTTPGDGMINSNVISTDTAAMNMQNSVNKANQDKKTNK